MSIIESQKAPEPVGPYPHARKVGNLLLLSGIGPRERGKKEGERGEKREKGRGKEGGKGEEREGRGEKGGERGEKGFKKRIILGCIFPQKGEKGKEALGILRF